MSRYEVLNTDILAASALGRRSWASQMQHQVLRKWARHVRSHALYILYILVFLFDPTTANLEICRIEAASFPRSSQGNVTMMPSHLRLSLVSFVPHSPDSLHNVLPSERNVLATSFPFDTSSTYPWPRATDAHHAEAGPCASLP